MATPTNHIRRRARALVATGVLLWVGSACLTGCGRNPSADPTVSAVARLAEDCVARVGDIVISRETFEREWRRRDHRSDKKALLDELIRSAAILSQAKAAGYDRDPDVVARINQLIVAGFLEEHLAKRTAEAAPVSEATIDGFYRDNLERFTTPEVVRAGVIYLRCSQRATAEKRGALKEKAGSLLADARRSDARHFHLLASKHSEDLATRYVGGDTGWIGRDDRTLRWPGDVVEAAWSLSQPGDVAPLVDMADGFYIVRLTERRPAAVRPFEDVREAIHYQLTQEQRHRRDRDFFEEMKRGVSVEINAAWLESIPSRVQAREQAPPALPGS